MNAKNAGWESYTDPTGRRHWRWPAPQAATVPAAQGLPPSTGAPRQQPARSVARPPSAK